MEPKKLKIETTPELPAVTAPPTEEKARRKGLPAEGESWKASEHDMVVMGRLSRAIEGVPPAAMRRIAPWFGSLLNEAMRDPEPAWGFGLAQGQAWNAAARSYDDPNNYPADKAR